jgi:hypothetical protein
MMHVTLSLALLSKYIFIAGVIGFGAGYFLAWRRYGKAIETLNRIVP